MDKIKKYIAMPMAISVFRNDKERFEQFRLGNIYLDLLDAIIERMQQDFYQLKSEMNYVRKLGTGKYKINGEVVEFTSEELKQMTEELMSEYLMGIGEFERKDRIWDK